MHILVYESWTIVLIASGTARLCDWLILIILYNMVNLECEVDTKMALELCTSLWSSQYLNIGALFTKGVCNGYNYYWYDIALNFLTNTSPILDILAVTTLGQLDQIPPDFIPTPRRAFEREEAPEHSKVTPDNTHPFWIYNLLKLKCFCSSYYVVFVIEG